MIMKKMNIVYLTAFQTINDFQNNQVYLQVVVAI